MRAYGKDSEYKLKLKKEVDDDDVDGIVEKYKNAIAEVEEMLDKKNISEEQKTGIRYLISMEYFIKNKNIKEVFSYEKRRI